MITISPVYNRKVQIGIGIVSVLLVTISIILFWEPPKVVLEQTKGLCQDLKSLDAKDTSVANVSMEIKAAVWEKQAIQMDSLLYKYPSSDEQLINFVTRKKEFLSKAAEFVLKVQEHNNKRWTTVGQSLFKMMAGTVGVFTGKLTESVTMFDQSLQEAKEYDKKSAAFKVESNELTEEAKSIDMLGSQVKSLLFERYKIECISVL